MVYYRVTSKREKNVSLKKVKRELSMGLDGFEYLKKQHFKKSITLRTNAKTEMVRLYIEGDMTARDAK